MKWLRPPDNKKARCESTPGFLFYQGFKVFLTSLMSRALSTANNITPTIPAAMYS